MRFGCCISPDAIPVLAGADYDFCELPARAVLPFEDDAGALSQLRMIAAAALRPEAFNLLVPAELPMAGPHADHDALRLYLRRAFRRMAQLGGVVAALGSGAARSIPPAWPRDRALDQLADALVLAGEEAGRAGIELALEHLNQRECNVFNSLAECRQFIRERGLRDVRLLADLHHLEVEGESFSALVDAGPLLAHVHVADGGRRPPGAGGYRYAEFMAALRAAGYDRRISAECTWDDLGTQAASALAYMRDQWSKRNSVYPIPKT